MSSYQQSQDLQYAQKLVQLASTEAKAFLNLKAAAERPDGKIPPKYRELISVAVAITTQCPYCIEAHTKNAVKAGVTGEELAEAIFITSALQAGAAVGHGLLALRLFGNAQGS